jgi:hypothetical protein
MADAQRLPAMNEAKTRAPVSGNAGQRPGTYTTIAVPALLPLLNMLALLAWLL